MPTPNVRYIIANWKMNLGLAEVTKWFDDFRRVSRKIPDNKVVIIAPSAPYLGMLAEMIDSTDIKLAAQDISLEQKGAHTGQTGIFQIKDFCDYAIIGHSELKEAFELSLKKRDLCLENKIIPIVCINTKSNMKIAYKDGALVTWEDPATISVNGVYKAHDANEIESDILDIRRDIPTGVPLIYGGSVNRQNIEDLANINGLDGILVGNASCDPVHFAELISKF